MLVALTLAFAAVQPPRAGLGSIPKCIIPNGTYSGVELVGWTASDTPR